MRLSVWACVASLLLIARGALAQESFPSCLAGIKPLAQAAGVSERTFTAATEGVTPDRKILAGLDRQSEFHQPIWDYVTAGVSSKRVATGRAWAEKYAAVLTKIERQYGVDRHTLLGVIGMETNFGSHTGGLYVVRSLATLACAGYRGTFFRDQLIEALQILEQGHVTRAKMLGSWAGAMGQTQFMPSSFMRYAVDFDGDGRKDIWNDVPDALASTANFLTEHGWLAGQPWGMEVALPKGFALTGAGRNIFQPFAAWRRQGVARVDGRPLPGNGEAALYLPAGIGGPAFLITQNFSVIKSYNISDSYVLAAGHLGDRIAGGSGIRAAWPRGERQLSHAERIDMQRRLIAAGYDVGKIDGRFGEKTSEAVRAFQSAVGMVPDGYASAAVLARLQSGPP
jgi:lytic murein transglycosylase